MTDFELVKDALDIKQVITSSTGLQMDKNRKHLEKCPFCDHKKCFSIMEDKQAYKCHSAGCEASGDVFTFLESYHHLDRGEALRKAADLANVKLSTPSTTRAVQESIKDRIFKATAEYYHQAALEGPGQAYFVERRQHDEKLIKDLKLGYSDGKLLDHLLGLNYSTQDVVNSGLATKFQGDNGDSGAERFKDFFAENLVIFPHFDRSKRVIHFTMKDTDKERGLGYQMRTEHRDKDWKFYNQKVLKGDSFIIVEGENDLLAVMSAGHRNVMAINGSLAEYQLAELQAKAKHKIAYLWFDKDDAGNKYVEKVCKALREKAYSVEIIEHPGEAKDADEYLKAFTGDPRKEVQHLLDKSVDYTHWQLRRMAELKDIGDIIKALSERRIFSTIASMPPIERLPYIEVLKRLGLDDDSIKAELEVNKELRDLLDALRRNAPGGQLAKAKIHEVIRIIYDHFSANGKFFRDCEHTVYLLYQNIIYEVGNNRPFNALMDKSGGLLFNRAPGPQTWEGIANKGYNEGKFIEVASWLAIEERDSSIYVNFNAADNTILKISPGEIREVPNGLNEDDVLLKASSKIKSLRFDPEVSKREGLETLKSLILDNMACELEQRYLIICWAISAFLLNFMPYQAIMKFSGGTKSGKTTTAKLLSKLIYGDDEMGTVSQAAAYSVAAQNPMLIMDNLEEKDRGKGIKTFILLAATGGGKEKRAGGTDSDTVKESPKSLVLITAIEPLNEPELINRSLDIDFNRKHKGSEFIESSVMRTIGKQRDIMISAILKLISNDILPNLEEGIKANLTILKKQYANHSKDRTDEYLALLMLILEKIIPHMPLGGKNDNRDARTTAAEIWGEWIGYQDRISSEDETLSNSILMMLDGMAAEYVKLMVDKPYSESPSQPGLKYAAEDIMVARLTHNDYLIEAEKTDSRVMKVDEHGKPCEAYSLSYISFTATSNELVAALSAWCRDKGRKNPYDNAGIFTKRLQNDKETLRRAGWDMEIKEGLRGPYSKMIRGKGYLTLRKTLAR